MNPAFVRWLVVVSLLIPDFAAAQAERVAASDPPKVQERDSVQVLARARSAQAGFERYRFRHLPRTHARGSGECDEVIGRICFWFSEDSDGDALPPEPPVIAERRSAVYLSLTLMISPFLTTSSVFSVRPSCSA